MKNKRHHSFGKYYIGDTVRSVFIYNYPEHGILEMFFYKNNDRFNIIMRIRDNEHGTKIEIKYK